MRQILASVGSSTGKSRHRHSSRPTRAPQPWAVLNSAEQLCLQRPFAARLTAGGFELSVPEVRWLLSALQHRVSLAGVR